MIYEDVSFKQTNFWEKLVSEKISEKNHSLCILGAEKCFRSLAQFDLNFFL